MEQINKLITVYRELLNKMWSTIKELEDEPNIDELMNDWKQANWEIIVESNLKNTNKIYLQPYGEGADYYGDSSRILSPNELPTHAVHCNTITGAKDLLTDNKIEFPSNGYQLENFVTMKNDWYYEEPPFDCVLILDNKNQYIFKLEDIYFTVEKIC
jgi:hypothetical protein